MLKLTQSIHPVLYLLVATLLEVSGDAIVRMGIVGPAVGPYRIALFVVGAALLFGYGVFLNSTPIAFGEVVGLYIATLFVVWQVMNFAFFRVVPTVPVLVGGALVIAGGLTITFWKV